MFKFKIHADEEGNILTFGTHNLGEVYEGEVPEDFTNGKYFFIDSKIILNENYIEDNVVETNPIL